MAIKILKADTRGALRCQAKRFISLALQTRHRHGEPKRLAHPNSGLLDLSPHLGLHTTPPYILSKTQNSLLQKGDRDDWAHTILQFALLAEYSINILPISQAFMAA